MVVIGIVSYGMGNGEKGGLSFGGSGVEEVALIRLVLGGLVLVLV